MCNCTVCYANNVSQFNERIGILGSPQLGKTVLLLEYWCAPRLMLFYHTKIKNDQYTEIPTSMAISCHLKISVVMCKCTSTSISVCSSAYVSILNKSYANININQFKDLGFLAVVLDCTYASISVQFLPAYDPKSQCKEFDQVQSFQLSLINNFSFLMNHTQTFHAANIALVQH